MNDVDVRTRILDEATRLFGRRGYGATSVRELAEAVGVTKPTLYYWFDSKEALYLATMERHAASFRDTIAEAFSADGGPVERLGLLARLFIERASDNPDGVRLFLLAEAPRDADQPQIDLIAMHSEALLAIQHLLADGVASGAFRSDLDAMTASLALLGALHLHVVAHLHGMPLAHDACDRIIRLFLHGVTAP